MYIERIYIPSVFTNCYLLADEDSGQGAVIDPGDGDDATLVTIGRLLEEKGLTLRYVLLTHGHYDHVGGVGALCRAFGGPHGLALYIHRADLDAPDPRLFPLPTILEREGIGGINFYDEGDHIALGAPCGKGLDVEVLHTPGHTKGSVCLRCRDVLFTGDTLFAGSCGRTDFPGGDHGEMMASLRRLAGLEGDFRVLPGHEGETTLGRERAGNYYMRQAMGG